jgi:hypothetical protein
MMHFTREKAVLYGVKQHADIQIVGMREHQSRDRDMRFCDGCRIPGIMVPFKTYMFADYYESRRAFFFSFTAGLHKLTCISTKVRGAFYGRLGVVHSDM